MQVHNVQRQMTIDPEEFVKTFEDKWTDEFSQVTSESFRQTWRSIGNTLNEVIDRNLDEFSTSFNDALTTQQKTQGVRLVLPPHTGTGKTKGHIHYASMMYKEHKHIGALIISRLVSDCDEIAQEINENAEKYFGKAKDEKYAVAFHSQQDKVSLDTLKDYPVVVITHEYFYRNHDQTDRRKKEKFNNILQLTPFNARGLVVIDEAIDLVKETQIDSMKIEPIYNLLMVMKDWKRYKKNKAFLEEVFSIKAWNTVFDIMKQEIEEQIYPLYIGLDKDVSNALPTSMFGKDLSRKEFPLIKRAFKEDKDIKVHQILMGKNNRAKDSEVLKSYIDVLDSFKDTSAEWAYMYKSGGKVTWNTAQENFPKGLSVAILDATAPTNHIYKVMEEMGKGVKLIPRVENVRNYSNVTLNVALGHKTGRDIATMENAQQLMSNVQEVVSDSEKVLVICHLKMEPFLETCKPSDNYTIVHWGNITCKNTWQDFDVCVVFGLPHKDGSYTVTRQITASSPDRVLVKNLFAPEEDIKEERLMLVNSDLAQEVIQGINRIKCRKTIDEYGNCEPTRIYIALGENNIGRNIVESITKQLPGIYVEPWELDMESSKRNLRKGKWNTAAPIYLKTEIKEIGDSIKAVDVRDALECHKKSWEKLTSNKAFLNGLKEGLGIIYHKPEHSKRFYEFTKIN